MNIVAELKAPDGVAARPRGGPRLTRSGMRPLRSVIGVLTVAPKQFKTGSRGYYANGKRYQAQIQLVEIGSKAGAKPGPEG